MLLARVLKRDGGGMDGVVGFLGWILFALEV